VKGDSLDYDQAVRFLEKAFNLERSPDWKYGPRLLSLTRMRALAEALGNPQRSFRTVHVAGTKGKGTTAGAIARLLQDHGLRTGLVTSPHLVTPRERACIDGEMLGKDEFVRSLEALRPYVEEQRRREAEPDGQRAPTYFEMMTALAFHAFRERRVHWAVVEVGLGGRLDSTNIVEPDCCVITSIGFEHMDKLGSTAAAIAAEKAGIMKPGVPVVIAGQQYGDALAELRRTADERGCRRWEAGRELAVETARPLAAPSGDPAAEVGWRFDLKVPGLSLRDVHTPMLGRHQLDNLAAACGALALCAGPGGFEVKPDVCRAALRNFTMPARLEVLRRRPAVVLDVAHTVESVAALMEALEDHFPGRPVHMVFGCSKDKRLDDMLALLRGRLASFTATRAVLSRAMPTDEVAAAAVRCGVTDADHLAAVPDSWEAVRTALAAARPDDIVCVAGSLFVAGEIRARWFGDPDGLDSDAV
jgi:dihydrofolate synthase/folylpolyglutamate synthase